MIDDQEKDMIADRLHGWELVEFLQVSVEDILLAALENDWINDDNIDDLLEYIGVKNDG